MYSYNDFYFDVKALIGMQKSSQIESWEGSHYTSVGYDKVGNLISMIMNHSSGYRDNQEEGVAHEVKSPENQSQFSQPTMGQYCRSPTLP